MRADMAKVIVERPRHKGWAGRSPKGRRRALQRYGEDEPPRCEGIKRPWIGRAKRLNEHLGPLRRYLDKQVGRPWDKAYAEICAHLRRDSAVQDHVRDHVAAYVVTHVQLKDGVPCGTDGHWLRGGPLRPGTWYVCPRSRLLRKVPLRARRPRRPAAAAPAAFIRVNELLQCHFIDGGWFLVALKPLPTYRKLRAGSAERDVLFDQSVDQIDLLTAQKRYGAAVYAVEKHRMTRREQRSYPIPVGLRT